MADPTPENNEERESEELETAAGAEADIGEASAAEAESPTEELSLEEMVEGHRNLNVARRSKPWRNH